MKNYIEFLNEGLFTRKHKRKEGRELENDIIFIFRTMLKEKYNIDSEFIVLNATIIFPIKFGIEIKKPQLSMFFIDNFCNEYGFSEGHTGVGSKKIDDFSIILKFNSDPEIIARKILNENPSLINNFKHLTKELKDEFSYLGDDYGMFDSSKN